MLSEILKANPSCHAAFNKLIHHEASAAFLKSDYIFPQEPLLTDAQLDRLLSIAPSDSIISFIGSLSAELRYDTIKYLIVDMPFFCSSYQSTCDLFGTLLSQDILDAFIDQKLIKFYKAYPVADNPAFRHSTFLSLLIYLMQHDTNEQITLAFANAKPTDLQHLRELLIYNSEMSVLLLQYLVKTKVMAFCWYYNNANSNLYPFMNAVLESQDSEFNHLIQKIPKQFTLRGKKPLFTANVELGRFSKTLGRTLLFEDGADHYQAIKILKRGEHQGQLIKQYHTDRYLLSKKTALKLQGEIPTAGQMLQIADVNILLDQLLIPAGDRQAFLDMAQINADGGSIAYVYKAKKEYFEYLSSSNISVAQFKLASINAIHDILILLMRGIIFNQFADLYHCHLNKRSYIAVGTKTPGDLERWQASVKFPNLRLGTGLADSGDWCNFDTYDPNGYWSNCSPMNVGEQPSRKISEYIGRLLLVINLCGASAVVDSFAKREFTQTEKDHKWSELSRALKNIHQFTYNKLAELFGVQLPQRFFTITCDHYEYLAKQMGFWCDASRHWQDLSKFSLPEGLYPPDCKYTFDNSGASEIVEKTDQNCNEIEGIIGVKFHSQHLGFDSGLFPLDVRAHGLVSTLTDLLAPAIRQSRQRLGVFRQYNATKQYSGINEKLKAEVEDLAYASIKSCFRVSKFQCKAS